MTMTEQDAALVVRLRASDLCDLELAPIVADRIESLSAEVERLRDLLCLADELLMEAKGAFPLPGNPLRQAYLKIREVSGDDYHTRKNRARAALEATK